MRNFKIKDRLIRRSHENIRYKRFTIREFSVYYSKIRNKRFTMGEISAYYSKTEVHEYMKYLYYEPTLEIIRRGMR